MALEVEVRVETTVTDSGRRFVAPWSLKEVDAARHRQKKREATKHGQKLLSYTEAWNLRRDAC